MLRKFFLLVSVIYFIGCNSNKVYQLPDVYVDEVVYINNPSNLKLQSQGGWAYVDGGIKGLEGIILYRNSENEFTAYDRSCPHLEPSECTIMDVSKDIIAECECDGSTFLLATGEPLSGAPTGLKRYKTYYDAHNATVRIVN